MALAVLGFQETQAQQMVQESDFSRRPQFYQNKTILIRNVLFNQDENGSNMRGPNRNPSQRPSPNPMPRNNRRRVNRGENQPTHGYGGEKFSMLPPRCRPTGTNVLVYPVFEQLQMPLCFQVMRRIEERLPKGEFRADITLQVDVRGISTIKRIRVR